MISIVPPPPAPGRATRSTEILDIWRRPFGGDPRGELLAQKGRNFITIVRVGEGRFRVGNSDFHLTAVRAARAARRFLNR